MGYQTITAKPVSGALGAIIEGVDLARDLDNAHGFRPASGAARPLRHLFPRPAADAGAASGARPALRHAQCARFVEAMPGHPEILVVAKYESDTKNFGGGWHSDVTYLDEPALGSILYALEVPDYGGDTMFANQYMAYEALSPGMKRMLDGLSRSTARATLRRRRRQRLRPAAGPFGDDDHAARRRIARPSIRWCAPIPRPAARASTSTATSPSASRT